MAVLYTPHFVQFFDDNGDPLNGGKLYTYQAGTETPKATYTTAAAGVQNANPVELDAAGRAVIFLSGSYKFRLETSAGALVKETDNVTAFGVTSGSANSSGVNQESGTTYELVASDNSLIVEFTGSSNATWSFDDASALGNGWFCYLKNKGTANITLDPSGAELIDGLSNYVMYPGEVRLVVCDGSAFTTCVLNGFYAAFTSSGTFTKPPGYQAFDTEAWGAGGGGASGRRGAAGGDRFAGGPGGGGGYNRKIITASAVGTTETVTIGAGGTAGAAVTANDTDGNNGGNGGNSTFGTLLTAYGGGGGTGGTNSASTGGAGGGTGSAAALNVPGGPTVTAGTSSDVNAGFGGAFSGTDTTGSGGASGWGGGGGGWSRTSSSGGAGGSSAMGGGGGGGGGSISSANTARAGGAGGSQAGLSGGGGAAGATTPTSGTAGVNLGEGGGGGGSHASAAGGAGGAGGPAGGGGGGAASANGANSGAGGVGGRGEIRVRGIL
jgi:hypothetical protein